MKCLFGALLCFVLAQTQAWAISGGPNYGGVGSSFVGSYSGVLQPTFCPEPNPANCPGLNSLGVFSIAVPNTGTATGSFVMFARGRVFNGTISGTADPNKAALNAVVSATFNYTIQVLQTTTTTSASGVVTTGTQLVSIPITAKVNGSLNAKFKTATTARVSTTASTTLRGDATLYVEQGQVNATTGEPVVNGVLTLTVAGFRQSTTAPNTTTTSSPAATG